MNKKRGGMLTDALLGLLVMSVVTAAVYGYCQISLHHDDWRDDDLQMDIWSQYERCDLYCPEDALPDSLF